MTYRETIRVLGVEVECTIDHQKADPTAGLGETFELDSCYINGDVAGTRLGDIITDAIYEKYSKEKK